MDKNGLFIAAMLDSASKAYAAGAATRILEALPKLSGTVGFEELTTEFELRVRVLAESLAADRSALFASELRWLKVLYSSRGQDWSRLVTELDCLETDLLDRLPSSASHAVRSHIAAAREALPDAPTTLPGHVNHDDAPHVGLVRRYLFAVLEGRGDDAVASVVDAANSGIGVDALHDHVIIPAQQEIGRMWLLGEIHVAEEHLATGVATEALTLLRSTLPRPANDARRILAAGASGSQHDIGLRIAADRLRMAGWNPIMLGADVPSDDCARAARENGVDLVAVSVPMVLNLRQGYATIVSLKEAGFAVLAGGRTLGLVDDLWRVLGADAGAPTASDVVAAAERACSSRP